MRGSSVNTGFRYNIKPPAFVKLHPERPPGPPKTCISGLQETTWSPTDPDQWSTTHLKLCKPGPNLGNKSKSTKLRKSVGGGGRGGEGPEGGPQVGPVAGGPRASCVLPRSGQDVCTHCLGPTCVINQECEPPVTGSQIKPHLPAHASCDPARTWTGLLMGASEDH